MHFPALPDARHGTIQHHDKWHFPAPRHFPALRDTPHGTIQHQGTFQHQAAIQHLKDWHYPAPRHFPALPNTPHGTIQHHGTFQHKLSSTMISGTLQHQGTFHHFKILIPYMEPSSTNISSTSQYQTQTWHFPAPADQQHSPAPNGHMALSSTKKNNANQNSFQHQTQIWWHFPQALSSAQLPIWYCPAQKKQTNWVHSSTNGVALSSTNPVENYMPRISQHREHCYYKKKHLMDPNSFRFGAGLFHGQAGR